jgi:hypothetical protein
MRKFILFSAVVLFFSPCRAQFSDSFTDGNFTLNPSWTGDESVFAVNASAQLQLTASGEGISALSSGFSAEAETEWNFWVKLGFAPSDNNMARVYLTADQQDLKSPLNGYYIRLGESGSADAIELVRQSGTIHSVVCRGTDGQLAAAFAIRIKVKRLSGGLWKVYADPAGGINYQLQCTGTDNSLNTGSYLGIFCKYTSSNSSKFYFDDFYAGPVITDVTPPAVLSVTVISPDTLCVRFSEAVDPSSACQPSGYQLIPGTEQPMSVIQDATGLASVSLIYTKPIAPDQDYMLHISGVKDLAGNLMIPADEPFRWHQIRAGDVLINEVMADPSPAVGLPEAEYIELYNRSSSSLNLRSWTLILGSSRKTFPEVILPAGGYLILCDDGTLPLLQPYGAAVAFSSLAVTNTGGTITLEDSQGFIIHSIFYETSWYGSAYKSEGGWSLEQKDPLNPCGGISNWTASTDPSGGTPGRINSVNTPNPDLISPRLSRAAIRDPQHLMLWFSEPCDSLHIRETGCYRIDNAIGEPLQVIPCAPDFSRAELQLAVPLAEGLIYTLSLTDTVTDCAGNPVSAGSSLQFAIPVDALAGDLVINELLFDPPSGGVDFVEIANRSAKVIDLKTLILANYDTLTASVSSAHPLSEEPYLIFPGMIRALTTDSAVIKQFYPMACQGTFVQMGSFPVMNNEDGLVALCRKGGEVLDQVSYSADIHYPLLTSVDGVSLERISQERPSGERTNWHSASETCGYATPGCPNSQSAVSLTDPSVEISLYPDIFSPDSDGYNDVLTLAYHFDTPGNNLTLTVFDSQGRLVRTLISHELCGTTGAFTWDGTRNDRQKAAIGRYIILAEIFDMGGKVRRMKFATVLGGKL